MAVKIDSPFILIWFIYRSLHCYIDFNEGSFSRVLYAPLTTLLIILKHFLIFFFHSANIIYHQVVIKIISSIISYQFKLYSVHTDYPLSIWLANTQESIPIRESIDLERCQRYFSRKLLIWADISVLVSVHEGVCAHARVSKPYKT